MRASSGPLSRGIVLGLVTLGVLLAGCSASVLGNMWRDESFTTTGMKHVLVVALRTDAVKRRLWEDSFAKGLAAYGAKATPSYQLWASALPDTQQVIEAVRRDGYDGVLVSMRHADGTQQVVVSGYTRKEAVTQKNPFTGAYYTYWKDVQVPDRVESQAVANFQTDVWTTGVGGRLVWSGMSSTTDGVDVVTIDNMTRKLVLPELSKTRVLAAKQGK